MRLILVLALVLIGAAAVSIPKAMRCPQIADAHVATGWQEYRNSRLGNANSAFTSALARCPGHSDAEVGLGYVALRSQAFDNATSFFESILRHDPSHTDALVGLGLVQVRLEEYDSARAIFTAVLTRDPTRADAREHLHRLPPSLGPAPVRAPLVLPDSVEHFARVNGSGFETRSPAVSTPGAAQHAQPWQPFYVKGVNLGVALPGRYPSEFPDAATYASWLADIAAMGANTIRVYTLHPPAFYQALADHNAAQPGRPLHLIQGVWAELPPGDDFDDTAWRSDFFGELERAIDVLHGRADVRRRPGHAAGYYTADVSRWTLGLIIGREWEPFSVSAYNRLRPDQRDWQGRFLHIEQATPMDVWLTRALEHVIAYETDRYHAQRPVAYTNWPTLDPMRHGTELDVTTELAIRGLAPAGKKRDHNEDEVSLGVARVVSTDAYRAGTFQAFHVYPYYPDFFLHDPGYLQARSPFGPSSYYGYLRDLKSHFPDVPVLIAEYGVPTGWGISHFNPQGWHHGGHAEADMARINARLTREVAAAGMAGGVLFSWIDEWFKTNWLAEPLEQPAERNRLWLNRMNPEQHYGIVALEPVPRLGETLADRRAAWDTVTPLYETADGTRIRAHADEAYLWLHVSGPAQHGRRLVIGFDIADPAGGGTRFPGADAPRSPVGLEFVLQFDSSGARVLATPRANPFRLQTLPAGATTRNHDTPVANRPAGFFAGSYTQVLNEPFDTRPRDDGRFDPLWVAVNRARVGLDSTNYFGLGYDRGVLRQGPLPDGAWERARWANAVEVRIPWTLLNVTDPSSRHVVFEQPGQAPDGVPGSRQVDAIRIVAAAQDSAGRWHVWPESGRRSDAASFTWATWDEPRFRMRRRPVFDALRSVFRELDTPTTFVSDR